MQTLYTKHFGDIEVQLQDQRQDLLNGYNGDPYEADHYGFIVSTKNRSHSGHNTFPTQADAEAYILISALCNRL